LAEPYRINMVVRDYDIMGPLAKGDVEVRDIALTLDRKTQMAAFRDGPFQAGEVSMSKYLIGLSQGDRSLVGLPAFPMRSFRHRCFFVLRDSGLRSFKDLEGKRAGTNGWSDTGNTWSRAAMRAEGVDINSIEWWVGTIDPTTDKAFGHTSFTSVPEGINAVPQGRTLQDMLIDGEIDAMMCPWPPRRFYEENGPIVRLLEDYPAVEKAYYEQVGYYPAHHIVAVKREVFDEAPWAAVRLFEALERSRLHSQQVRWALTDVTPWSITELEETVALLGQDWQPFGAEQNRKMLADFCAEQFAQGLVEQKVDPLSAFAEFERALAEVDASR